MSIHNAHPVKLGNLLVLSTADNSIQLNNAHLHVEYVEGSETEVDIRVTFEGDEALWSEIQQRSIWCNTGECGFHIWWTVQKPSAIALNCDSARRPRLLSE